jgi:hypothetical protein
MQDAVEAAFEAARGATGRKLAVLIDGLEKVNGGAAAWMRETFEHTRLLTDTSVTMVVAAPPCPFTDTNAAADVGLALRGRLRLRPRRPAVPRGGHGAAVPGRGLPGRRRGRAGAARRLAVEAGGHPRHAMQLLHECAVNALTDQRDVLAARDVDAAIRGLREQLEMGLAEPSYQVLDQVDRRHRLPGDDLAPRLFSDGRILVHPPTEAQAHSYHVHPQLRRALAQYRDSLDGGAPRMTAPLDATVAWLGLATRGWGLVVVAPGQQRAVAEALAARVPTRPAVALDPAWSDDEDAFLERLSDAPEGGAVFVDAAVGLDQEVALWRALNGRRDWLADRGVWVIVASHRQVARLTAHAGDLASVARRCEVVAFTPRALSEVERAAARAELHAHYQRRFGRLDLRGFIRSEREDVSFPVEAIYQPLRASSDSRYPVVSVAPDPAAPRWLSIVDLLAARRARDPRVPHLVEAPPSPTLLVGGPGSGKSFFLRHCAIAASGAARFAGQDRPLPIYLALAALRARPSTAPWSTSRSTSSSRPGWRRLTSWSPRPRPGAPCFCSTASTRSATRGARWPSRSRPWRRASRPARWS